MGYVVCLLAIAALPEPATATYRTETTAFGGMLALLIYAAWPTWEGATVRDRIADLLDAHRRYVAVLFVALIHGIAPDRARVNRTRGAARLARSNAEASVQRMLGEPASHRSLDADVAVGLLATTRRHALAALALQARIDGTRPPRPELEPLAAQMTRPFARSRTRFGPARRLEALPPLRATQEQLRAVTRSSLVDETDVIVDSLNTMAEMLGKRS